MYAMLRVLKREKENDSFLGVQDFPFWGRSRIARSLGFRVSDTKRHIVLSSCVVVASHDIIRLTLLWIRSFTSESDFYITYSCEICYRVLRSKSSMKKSFADYLYLAIIEK